MNLIFFYIISGILFLIIMAGIVYIIKKRVEGMDEPENEDWIINLMPQYSKGHALGIKRDIQFGEKRIELKLSPRDINYIRELKENKDANMGEYTLYFDKRQVIPFPISSHRNIIICLPDDMSLLPESIKETRFGRLMMGIIAENNKLDDESELMKQRMNHLKNISGKTFGGEITDEYMEVVSEILKDKSELIKKEERKKDEK